MKGLLSSIMNRCGMLPGSRDNTRARTNSMSSMFEPLEARKLLTDIDIQVLSRVFLDAALDEARNSPGTDVIQWKDADGNLLSGWVDLGGTELSLPDGVTLQGNGLVTLNANSQSRVARIEAGAAVTLDGLTLRNGSTPSDGGAIRNDGQLTLTNSTVTGSIARSGGGIDNRSQLTLINSTVSANRTRDTFGSGGGILSGIGASATIFSSRIENNEARFSGGGIANYGSMYLQSSTVSGNSSGADFTGAYDRGGGGIFSGSAGQVTLQDSTVSGNTAVTSSGGGIQNTGTFTVRNSTIAGNSSGNGGGISDNGTMAIRNSTIAFNHAGVGGGLDTAGNDAPNPSLTNSIVADNTTPDGKWTDIHGAADLSKSRHNLIGSPVYGGGMYTGDGMSNQTGLDPMFTSTVVTDNGGRTKTLAIGSGSPANGMGNSALSDDSYDQRGAPFARNGSFTVGAYQVYSGSLDLVVDTTSDANDGDYSAGNLSLREAILLIDHTSNSDTITFASGLNNRSITLNGTPLVINSSVTISGPGADLLTISGNNLSRVFTFESGISTLSGVTVANGYNPIGGGGGVHNSGVLTITSSLITRNRASLYGGGVENFGFMTIVGSTLSYNSADVLGGGIANFDGFALTDIPASSGRLTVKNSTLSNNTAGSFGGAVFSRSDNPVSFANSTIAFNIAGSLAGGGGICFDRGPLTSVSSTIVAGNKANSNDANEVSGTFPSGSTHNLIQDPATAGGLSHGTDGNIVGFDPLLRDLDDNGGPMQTHRIDFGSPAIGAGRTFESGDLSTPATDQRGDGYPRVRGGVVDIGAYERGVAPTIGSLSASSATVAPGGSVTLTANDVADADGPISRVLFLLDDGDGVVEGDQDTLIGFDNDGSNGFSVVYAVPGDAAPGDKKFFAVAADDEDSRSEGAAATVTVQSQAPTIGSVTLSSLRVREGTPVVLTANNVVAVTGHSIARVEFFWFKSNDPFAPNIVKIGQDETGSDGWTFPLDTSLSGGASPIRTATGYYAVAVDNLGNASKIAWADDFGGLEILGFPLLGASAGSSGNINITTGDVLSPPTIFQQQAGATTWTKSDLQAKTSSPTIVGEIVSWVDPKDGRNYAAAMTEQGLGLFTNTSGSTWTFRNLHSEVPGVLAFSGNLTVFTSTDNKVSIAGVGWGGDLIRFVQTGASSGGNYTWTAFNHSEELRAQGLSQPQFVGRITSFVTPWNALNVVGLDANGQIQAVWWHQSLNTAGKWTTNNLSQEYGAPTLTGGLTVWQTSWNAINIGGTDTSGKLSATWWVAGQNNNQWRTNNLTDDAGGPLLEPSSMCSWVTPWGAMNIAGRESDGTISVYWWVPGVNNNPWNIEKFREEVPAATLTSGPITGITALAGGFSMSILSTSKSGDVMRLWWTPATNTWAEQNLTQTAVVI